MGKNVLFVWFFCAKIKNKKRTMLKRVDDGDGNKNKDELRFEGLL